MLTLFKKYLQRSTRDKTDIHTHVVWLFCLPCVFNITLPSCHQEGSVTVPPLFFACFYVWLSPVKACWTLPAVGRHWADRRLFYSRLQEGQIQNQWGNCSAALNSISETPNGRIINMTDRGKRRDERKKKGKAELLLVWNVKRTGVMETQRFLEDIFGAKQNFILQIYSVYQIKLNWSRKTLQQETNSKNIFNLYSCGNFKRMGCSLY